MRRHGHWDIHFTEVRLSIRCGVDAQTLHRSLLKTDMLKSQQIPLATVDCGQVLNPVDAPSRGAPRDPYAVRARGDGTRRAYRSSWAGYVAWCRSLSREPSPA